MNNAHMKSDDFKNIISLYDRRIAQEIKKFEDDASEAEDLKQEIYIKILKNLICLNKDLNLWAWIKKVTANHCLNHNRDKKKFKFIDCCENEGLDLLENIPDTKTDPSNDANLDINQQIIYNKVCQLNTKFKEVIILYDYENLNYEEIAKKLGCPIGTVKSRLFKARMLLKEELKNFLN